MKKRLLAIFLAVAMLASMLVLPAGAADVSEEDITCTSAGFFKWLYEQKGDADAYDAYLLLTTGQYGSMDITDEKDGEFYAATELGNAGDATSLENLQATIEWLKECNELRQTDDNSSDLADLQVNSLLMAIAELDVNWSGINYEHAEVFYVAENLAWGYADPFEGWYTEEKAIYDAGESGETGHYTNIISSSYAVTGFAVSTSGTRTHGQVFYFSSNSK